LLETDGFLGRGFARTEPDMSDADEIIRLRASSFSSSRFQVDLTMGK